MRIPPTASLAFALAPSILFAVTASAADWQPAPTPLTTAWGRQVTPDTAWREYPRPQLVRETWQSLNGLWEYAIVDRPAGTTGAPAGDEPPPTTWDGTILVPFCVESSLSGVGRRVTAGQLLWYRRSFMVPEAWRGQRVMLRFEAVDWHATAWLNGQPLGTHAGGSDPFAFDVTPHLRPGDNELVLRVWDPTETAAQPRGKQKSDPESIWYTPVSGIWQSVWLEPVPPTHVTGIVPVADLAAEAVTFTAEVESAAADQPAAVAAVRIMGDLGSGRRVLGSAPRGAPVRFTVPKPRLWTPDDPHLYPVEVELVAADGRVVDRVGTYFAMRSIAIGPDAAGVTRLLLNGTPLFQFGPLDQGWWPDGLLTPPSDAAMRHDLEVLKRLGMNMLRKHIKVEPARYYHHCDRLGLLVWQDQPSGLERGRKQAVKADWAKDADFTPEEKRQFRAELARMIDRLRFFPSIVVWVPFNEGWGQHDTNEILRWVKERDPTRLVDGPSGWTDRGVGDLKDMHAYPGPDMFPTLPDRASVLGEFGGLGLPVAGHLWKDDGNWGYKSYTSEAEFRAAYRALVDRLHGLIARGLAAAVYTQTTDVEIEINGLLTYDRSVLKLDAAESAGWHRKLYEPPAAP